MKEEIHEFEDEAKTTIAQGEDPTAEQKQRMESELGDLLFALINVARLYHLKPDNALERTNQKFINRFNYVEQKAKEEGTPLNEMSLNQMESLWQEAKQCGI